LRQTVSDGKVTDTVTYKSNELSKKMKNMPETIEFNNLNVRNFSLYTWETIPKNIRY